MRQHSRFNLRYLAIALQIIPIVVIGLHTGFWIAGKSMHGLTTAGLLLAGSLLSIVYMRETIRVLNTIKLSNDEQAVYRLEVILANTKLALLLNLVGALFLLI